MTNASEHGKNLAALAALVRRRFPTADGVVCSHGDGDTILWQVVAGDRVLWDAGPDVHHKIPKWAALSDSAGLLHAALTADQTAAQDWFTVRFPQ